MIQSKILLRRENGVSTYAIMESETGLMIDSKRIATMEVRKTPRAIITIKSPLVRNADPAFLQT